MKTQIILLTIFLISTLISPVNSTIWDPFHSKTEKIDIWMQLWNQRVETDYETIGKTYLGNDIWRFKAGNPNDSHVLLDSERNGIEDKGSEILYLMAKWLLKSGDSSAEDTLTKIMCYLYRY